MILGILRKKYLNANKFSSFIRKVVYVLLKTISFGSAVQECYITICMGLLAVTFINK